MTDTVKAIITVDTTTEDVSTELLGTSSEIFSAIMVLIGVYAEEVGESPSNVLEKMASMQKVLDSMKILTVVQ